MTAFVDGHIHLTDAAAMQAALTELVGDHGERWRGAVSAWPDTDPTAPARWSLEINDHSGNTTTASLGDHLVLTYGRLLRLTDAEYLEV